MEKHPVDACPSCGLVLRFAPGRHDREANSQTTCPLCQSGTSGKTESSPSPLSSGDPATWTAAAGIAQEPRIFLTFGDLIARRDGDLNVAIIFGVRADGGWRISTPVQKLWKSGHRHFRAVTASGRQYVVALPLREAPQAIRQEAWIQISILQGRRS